MPQIWFTRRSAKRSQQLFANNGITLGIIQITRNNQAKIKIHRSMSWRAWHRGWDNNLCPWCETWCHSKILGPFRAFQLSGLCCSSLQPRGALALMGAQGGSEHLKDAGIVRSSSCCGHGGEFGATQPWDNYACWNLSLPAGGERPVQSRLESVRFSGPLQGPARERHAPYFTGCFVCSLQMWQRWQSCGSGGPRTMPAPPELCPPCQHFITTCSWAFCWDSDKCLSRHPECHTAGLAPPHTARERRNHPASPKLQFKPQKPQENLPLHHSLPA